MDSPRLQEALATLTAARHTTREAEAQYLRALHHEYWRMLGRATIRLNLPSCIRQQLMVAKRNVQYILGDPAFGAHNIPTPGDK